MNKKHSSLHTKLATAFLSFIAMQTVSAENVVVAGNYYNSNFQFPLLMSSQKEGEWLNPINSSHPLLPPNFINGSFESVDCSGMTCMASGFFSESTSGEFFPLIAMSKDGGAEWSYANLDRALFPKGFVNGFFSKVACKDVQCLASGSYAVYGPQSALYIKPWILQSLNGGKDWSFPLERCPLPLKMQNAEFATINCADAFCVAAGNYNFGYPLIAYSKDKGNSWVYAPSRPKPSLKAPINPAAFYSSACTDTSCVLVGYSFNDALPLIAYSDNGKKWSYPLSRSEPTLPSDFQSGSLTAAVCSEGQCMASGSYETKPKEGGNNNRTYPLLAQSPDKGLHWSYVVEGLNASLPSDLFRGGFGDLSCAGLACIAVGDYRTINGEIFPLVAQSADAGKTWQYRISSATDIFPEGAKGVRFTKASCSQSQCIAIGSYMLAERYNPLIVSTKDAGLTWTVLDATQMPLPADFYSGDLRAGDVCAAFLPKSLRFLRK